MHAASWRVVALDSDSPHLLLPQRPRALRLCTRTTLMTSPAGPSTRRLALPTSDVLLASTLPRPLLALRARCQCPRALRAPRVRPLVLLPVLLVSSAPTWVLWGPTNTLTHKKGSVEHNPHVLTHKGVAETATVVTAMPTHGRSPPISPKSAPVWPPKRAPTIPTEARMMASRAVFKIML